MNLRVVGSLVLVSALSASAALADCRKAYNDEFDVRTATVNEISKPGGELGVALMVSFLANGAVSNPYLAWSPLGAVAVYDGVKVLRRSHRQSAVDEVTSIQYVLNQAYTDSNVPASNDPRPTVAVRRFVRDVRSYAKDSSLTEETILNMVQTLNDQTDNFCPKGDIISYDRFVEYVAKAVGNAPSSK